MYENIPKLQTLIYPPTQYFNFSLPSSVHYSGLEQPYTRAKFCLWHLGLTHANEYQEDLLIRNIHTLLIEDKQLKAKLQSYLDVDLIPEMFKEKKEYYYNYNNIKSVIYPDESKMDAKLAKNEKLATLLKQLFNENISPGLTGDESLKKSPKTFMIVCEYDARKDEALIYAERLRRLNVYVDVAFYENGFHGMLLGTSPVSMSMRNDLMYFIKDNI